MKREIYICVAVVYSACAAVPALATTASSLSSFEGREEPTVVYHYNSDSFSSDSYTNITSPASGTFRMQLRFRQNDWWDGDQSGTNKDRQRGEVKGLGAHQHMNETYEYGTTWRSDSNFRGSSRFTHIFQLKATNGTTGPPMVTFSINDGTSSAGVKYCSGGCSSGQTTARGVSWARATWETILIRIHTSTSSGEVRLSKNGDSMSGKTGTPVYLSGSTDYRPKWGLYRGVNHDSPLTDGYIEHRNVNANKR
jgi:hypothetical protein